jgi:hypothetical protein
MKIFNILVAIIILSSCNSCKENKTEQLCSNRTPFVGNELRLDGYYYKQYDESPARREIIFLYRNGVLLHGGMVYLVDLVEMEESYASGGYYNLARNDQNVWGNFRLSNVIFSYEKWYPSTNNQLAFMNVGEIVNDTTFQILSSFRCDGSQKITVNDLFLFKHFPSKPDSTKQFLN